MLKLAQFVAMSRISLSLQLQVYRQILMTPNSILEVLYRRSWPTPNVILCALATPSTYVDQVTY
jgi:hypothetical protein